MAGEATFTLSEQDYVEASREVMRRYLVQPQGAASATVIVGAAVVGVAILVSEFRSAAPNPFAMAFGGAVLIWIVYCYGLGYLLMPGRARRLYGQQISLGKPYHYCWSEAGLSYSSDCANATYAWSDLHRWSDGRKIIVIFLNDLLFLSIPRRALTAGQIEDLVGTVERSGLSRL